MVYKYQLFYLVYRTALSYVFKAYLLLRIYKGKPGHASHLIDQVLVGSGVAVRVAPGVAGALAATGAAEVAAAQTVVL